MSKRTSLIVLVMLGLLVLLFAAGNVLVAWEWWSFLLILAALAFSVALVLTLLRRSLA